MHWRKATRWTNLKSYRICKTKQWWRNDATLREKHVVIDYNNKLILLMS